jgi:hypothetical protein
VSVQVELSERQLWLGVVKVALVLTFGLLLAAFIVSLVFSFDGGSVLPVTLNALLIAVAVSILANGVLTVLKIIDWFDERRRKGAKNG